MQLSVIIVSYNTAKLTKQTIESIEKSLVENSPLRKNFEVIVVDNQSSDDTLAVLKKIKAENKLTLKIVEAKENLGFGRANNLGFKMATGQEILFLNSDTVVQKGALENLVDFYRTQQKQKKIGLLAARLMNKDGTEQAQGGDAPSLLTLFNTMFFLDDIPFLGKLLPSVQHTGRRFAPKEVQTKTLVQKHWVAGTAVMIDRDLFEKMEGFDPAIFMYGEDQELAYRLEKKGYKNYILTTSKITHYGSASSSSGRAIVGEIKGYLYFWQKHKKENQFDYLRSLLWLAMLIRIVIFSFKKDEKKTKIYNNCLQVVENCRWQTQKN